MHRALARIARDRSIGLAGMCLAVGALIAAPALAAHTLGTAHSKSFDSASSSSQQSQHRAELPSGSRADTAGTRVPVSSAASVLSSRPEKSPTREAIDFPDHEVVTDPIGDFPDFTGPADAAQPVQPQSVNARIPGVSDSALARFQKRMYRKDI